MPQRKISGLLLLALCACSAREHPIDQTYTYSADLTRDGSKEKIILAIHGADISKPFKWSLSVTDTTGKNLYNVEKDDSWIDHAYGDPGYMSGCSGYEQCKRRYYFTDKSRAISSCLKSGETKSISMTMGVELSLVNARYFLEQKKTPAVTIEISLKELQVLLEGAHTESLCYSEHEQDHGHYLMWLETIGGFVPYHDY